ncbi:Holliday junction resolvase RecU [Paenibacillus sambharensis]|uniref:Holliday junction resolvase RecU n=1 Tax=Paenibacillus sambharensis TaxID=1803190 RepID=A0A2W1L8R6_9BACL|nr:Holliday junction resolvase RecU [Paenibacillus sambharensis]PZD95219.1 Holliday junction resolvase RecU [Paenibacillus sambharensis]
MSIQYANRGMGLETLIEYANAQYAAKGIANIQKIATPWKVVRRGKQIVTAFPEKKSTVDFIGVYEGRAIAFDAKETENKTRFPLANIEQHQVDFMRAWVANGGVAFFLINFKAHQQIFYLPFGYIDGLNATGATGSIPYKDFLRYRNVNEVIQGNGIALDYLKHVEGIA